MDFPSSTKRVDEIAHFADFSNGFVRFPKVFIFAHYVHLMLRFAISLVKLLRHTTHHCSHTPPTVYSLLSQSINSFQFCLKVSNQVSAFPLLSFPSMIFNFVQATPISSAVGASFFCLVLPHPTLCKPSSLPYRLKTLVEKESLCGVAY